MRLWPFRRRAPEQRLIDSTPFNVGPSRFDLGSATVDRALRLVPVYAASRLLADQVSSLPVAAYRQTGDRRQRIATPPLFVAPSAYGTMYDWVHRCMTSLVLRGNAYGLIVRYTATGTPAQIEWLSPDEVTVDETDRTRPRYWWLGREVPASDLLHIPGYTLPGRVCGVSPIEAFRITMETGLSAQQFGRDWFANGAHPTGVLSTDQQVDQKAANIVKGRFKTATSGGDIAVLGAGLQYKPITVPPGESQFIETMRMNASQIAAIYGIPPEMIGGESGNSLTYANVEQQSINFVSYTLRPWLVKLEAALSALLPRPQYVRFNVDAIVRADLKTRHEVYAIDRQIGLRSVNELRALEELPPLPDNEGNDYTPLKAAIPAAQTGGTA